MVLAYLQPHQKCVSWVQPLQNPSLSAPLARWDYKEILHRLCTSKIGILQCSMVWCVQIMSSSSGAPQIQVARAISGMRDPVAALSTAELATLSWRRRVHCLEVLWKLVNNQGPPQLRKLLPSLVSLRSPRVLRSRHSLQFPQCRTTSRLSSFFGWTIPICNSQFQQN